MLQLLCPALVPQPWRGRGDMSAGSIPTWFSLQTVEHGFPHQPSALGYSPSLRILAIGTRSGAVKLYPFCPPSSHWGKGPGVSGIQTKVT